VPLVPIPSSEPQGFKPFAKISLNAAKKEADIALALDTVVEKVEVRIKRERFDRKCFSGFNHQTTRTVGNIAAGATEVPGRAATWFPGVIRTLDGN